MEQLQMFERPSERAVLMQWIDARIKLFSTMTGEQRTAYVLNEVIARGGSDNEIAYWRLRLTPHTADAACAPAGNGDGETRGAADV